MTQGQMRYGAFNDEDGDPTVLQSQGATVTMELRNLTPLPGPGLGLYVQGLTGVQAVGTETGVTASSSSGGGNAIEGICSGRDASGVYGENLGGISENVGAGWGVAGRIYGARTADRAALLGESVSDPERPSDCNNGAAAGVRGYSETGYGGVFITGQAFQSGTVGVAYCPDSGGLRVVGAIVKTDGEYSEALPHPDGSQRLLYAPLCPESWYEDYGRAQLLDGHAEVELDADFAELLGIEEDDYHVFLTPEADTRGLYVYSRGARSFIVREQQAGTSTATFSYRVAVKNKHRRQGASRYSRSPKS